MKGGRLAGSDGGVLQTEGFEGGLMVARRTGLGRGRDGVGLGPMEDLRAGLGGPTEVQGGVGFVKQSRLADGSSGKLTVLDPSSKQAAILPEGGILSREPGAVVGGQGRAAKACMTFRSERPHPRDKISWAAPPLRPPSGQCVGGAADPV